MSNEGAGPARPVRRPDNSRKTSVTTYVPQRPPPGLDADEKLGSSSSSSRRPAGRAEEMLRRRRAAAWQVLSHWEGRDRGLQLLQSTSLLVHSLLTAPPHRVSYFSPLVLVFAFPRAARRLTLRRIHLASESIANLRRLLLLGRWLSEVVQAMNEALPSGQVTLKSDKEEEEKEREEEEEEDEAEKDQAEGVSSWKQKWRRRLEAGGEYLALLGEACDVAAFLGGSSILWRVAGGKVASTRQRRGLERIGVFFGLLSLLLSLAHIHLLRKEQRARVRVAHLALLEATDNLEYEDEEAEEAGHSALLSGRSIEVEDALGNSSSKAVSPSSSPRQRKQSLSKATTTSTSAAEAASSTTTTKVAVEELRRAEREAFLARKRMRHIGWEQTALRAEAVFCLAEVLAPARDHERLEAVTGTLSSLYGLAKIGGEARWGV